MRKQDDMKNSCWLQYFILTDFYLDLQFMCTKTNLLVWYFSHFSLFQMLCIKFCLIFSCHNKTNGINQCAYLIGYIVELTGFYIISLWYQLIILMLHNAIVVFSCDEAALQMVFSVCPSVRPSVRSSVCPSVCLSHLFDYVPTIVSSWNF